jgi:protocatechuate 3,4-dioxygenase beta subunit
LRQNVREDKYCDGVDVTLEVQYIDVNTCKPVKGAVVDIWNANATGVYRYELATHLEYGSC